METTIERIYRDVTGNKMPVAVKRILLPRQKAMHSPVEDLRMPMAEE